MCNLTGNVNSDKRLIDECIKRGMMPRNSLTTYNLEHRMAEKSGALLFDNKGNYYPNTLPDNWSNHKVKY